MESFLGIFFAKSKIACLFVFVCLIAALIFSAGYYCARIFYNSKNLNCIGALSFFLRSVHTFS